MNADAHAASPEARPIIDPAAFRLALGRFVTGVTIMTTQAANGARAGVTVSSFNTLSLDPPLILWSLSLRTPSLALFRETRHFAVNILADDQRELALQFARPAPDKFAGVAMRAGRCGAPLIEDAVAHLECEVDQRHPGGDHELIIGRILHVAVGEKTPLVYGQGRFGRFALA